MVSQMKISYGYMGLVILAMIMLCQSDGRLGMVALGQEQESIDGTSAESGRALVSE